MRFTPPAPRFFWFAVTRAVAINRQLFVTFGKSCHASMCALRAWALRIDGKPRHARLRQKAG
jgi:hypothetical protein